MSTTPDIQDAATMGKKKRPHKMSISKNTVNWEKLSDEDRRNIMAHRQELISKLQTHWGKTKQEAEEQIDSLISSI